VLAWQAAQPVMVHNVSRIVDTVTMQQYDLTSGDFLRVGIALVIVGLTILPSTATGRISDVWFR